MMSYFNEYDAIPICRMHARTEPVRTPKFSSGNASDKRQFCRLSLALSLPVRSHPKAMFLLKPNNMMVRKLQSCTKISILQLNTVLIIICSVSFLVESYKGS